MRSCGVKREWKQGGGEGGQQNIEWTGKRSECQKLK